MQRLMSIVIDVELTYFCLSVLCKAMSKMLIMCPEHLLF